MVLVLETVSLLVGVSDTAGVLVEVVGVGEGSKVSVGVLVTGVICALEGNVVWVGKICGTTITSNAQSKQTTRPLPIVVTSGILALDAIQCRTEEIRG